MVDSVVNDPLIGAVQELTRETKDQKDTIKTLVANGLKAEQRAKEQEIRDQQQHEKELAYQNKMQGQEVQVGRDNQLLQEKTKRSTDKLGRAAPTNGKMASDVQVDETNTLLGTLQEKTRELADYIPYGFKDNYKAITNKLQQSIDSQAGLENLFGAVKGDMSLMLGGLNALQQVPGFNILKVVLLTAFKWIYTFLGKIVKWLSNSHSLSEKQLQQNKKDKREMKKRGMVLDDTGRVRKKDKSGSFRFVGDKDLSKDELRMAKRMRKSEKIGRKGRFKASPGGDKLVKMFQPIMKKLGPFMKNVSKVLKITKLKLVLILGALLALPLILWALWDKIDEWFGWSKRKEFNESMEGENYNPSTGIKDKDITQEEGWFGFDKGDEAFYDERFGTYDIVRPEHIDQVSSNQLLTLLERKFNDLSLEHKIAIDKELYRRLDKEVTNTGHALKPDHWRSINRRRDEFNVAELERQRQRDFIQKEFGGGDLDGLQPYQAGYNIHKTESRGTEYYRSTTSFTPTDGAIHGTHKTTD